MEQIPFTIEVRTRLEEFLSRPRPSRAVATFDLDGTCEHHDTGEALLHSMARAGQLNLEAILESPAIWQPFEQYPVVSNPRREIIGAIEHPDRQPSCAKALIAAYWELLAHAGKKTAYSWAAYLLAGRTVDEIRAISRLVIAKELERALGAESIEGCAHNPSPLLVPVGLRPYEPMRDLVRRMHASGIECWIISATNRWMVEVYAEMFLGIVPHRICGITPRVRDGVIRGESDPDYPITVGSGKIAALDRFIGEQPIFTAGDSIGDWEMLMAAREFCLVIDKGDTEMRRRVAERKQAGERKWVVQPRFIDPPRQE